MQTVTCYDSGGHVISGLCQWDTNLYIEVSGADTTDAPDFHFCQVGNAHAYVSPSEVDNGRLKAAVPNAVLQKGRPLTVYLYYKDDNDPYYGRAMYSFVLAVTPRRKPDVPLVPDGRRVCVSGTTPSDYTYNDISVTYSNGNVVVTDILSMVNGVDRVMILDSSSLAETYDSVAMETTLVHSVDHAWEFGLSPSIASVASGKKLVLSLLAKTTGSGVISASIHDNNGNYLIGTGVTALSEGYRQYQFTLAPTEAQISAAKNLRVNYSASSGVLYVRDVVLECVDDAND